MDTVSIADILNNRVPVNKKVVIGGWVRTRRDSKAGISFLSVYDGSCFGCLQIIICNTLPNYQKDVLRLTTGCSVLITGHIIESSGKNQDYEIFAQTIKVLGWVDNPDTYPMSAKRHSMEHLRKMAHLRPRTNLIGAISRIRHTLVQAIHSFMDQKGFFWLASPLITTCDTEGSGELFRVSTLALDDVPRTADGKIDYSKDFFGKETFLTVSGQLTGESYACALSKIYTFGPTFRAEHSNTNRHLAEFWMVEVEEAFAGLDKIIFLAKEILKYAFNELLIKRSDDIQFLSDQVDKQVINRLNNFSFGTFNQISYTEAVAILQNCGKKFENPVLWGSHLFSEHERFLTDEHFKTPLIVKNYPKEIKPFYMRMNDDGKTVSAIDILFPNVGEIIGGSEREERLDKLDLRLESTSIKKENYWWYRDLRRYGTVPHAGFGLGLERLMIYVTGMKNVRDLIPFPRSPGNASF